MASTVVTLGAGPAENEIVFEDMSFEAFANIVIMVTPIEIELDQTRNDPTSQTRIFYDSPEFPTRIEFTCTPTSGKSCL